MYSLEIFNPAMVPHASGDLLDMTGTNTFALSWSPQISCMVRRISITVTTATVSNVSIVVNFIKRPTYGSGSGAVTIGSITIPTGVAAKSVYYKEINPETANSIFVPGNQLVVTVATAAGGGGAAGIGLPQVLFQYDPEVPLNLSNMVASA